MSEHRSSEPENICTEHLQGDLGTRLLVCPICHALHMDRYMSDLIRAKDQETILSENEK